MKHISLWSKESTSGSFSELTTRKSDHYSRNKSNAFPARFINWLLPVEILLLRIRVRIKRKSIGFQIVGWAWAWGRKALEEKQTDLNEKSTSKMRWYRHILINSVCYISILIILYSSMRTMKIVWYKTSWWDKMCNVRHGEMDYFCCYRDWVKRYANPNI